MDLGGAFYWSVWETDRLERGGENMTYSTRDDDKEPSGHITVNFCRRFLPSLLR